jgi:hypothetical protein
MIPGNNHALEQAAAELRRRAQNSHTRRHHHRAADFAAPEWPLSRGPTPKPRRKTN